MRIESFFPGRIRVSSPLFKKERVLAEVRERLSGRAGIREIRGNVRTGSLVVAYDASVVSTDELLQARAELEKLERENTA